jgi:hypothetical protein
MGIAVATVAGGLQTAGKRAAVDFPTRRMSVNGFTKWNRQNPPHVAESALAAVIAVPRS